MSAAPILVGCESVSIFREAGGPITPRSRAGYRRVYARATLKREQADWLERARTMRNADGGLQWTSPAVELRTPDGRMLRGEIERIYRTPSGSHKLLVELDVPRAPPSVGWRLAD